MNIYLIFNDRVNIPIFEVEISQEEDCFAKAHLVIEAGLRLPPSGTEGIIQGETLYFKGVLLGIPIKIEGYFAKIELIACPPDFSEKIKPHQKRYRIPPYWDPLWVKDMDNMQEIQDVHPSSLYCDRRTGELTRSHWFEGRHQLVIGEAFFQNSFRMRLLKPPLKACTVKVHAYWVQKEDGVTNLSTAIRLAFPRARVSTYTKDALLKKWPEPGQRIGRSGVWVVKSHLEEVTPCSSLYPLYSPPLLLEEEGGVRKPYRMKNHWFKPTLWVRWQYQQKRKETLVVTLHNSNPALSPGEGEHKVVDFTLQNINPDPQAYPWCPEAYYREGTKVFYQNATYRCLETHRAGLFFEPDKWHSRKIFHTPLGDPARASFFLTDRGYQAAEHAMERAKSILTKSMRAVEISFEAPWDVLKDVTTDSVVSLSDAHLPGGSIRGKVTAYSLIVKGETGERFGRVVMLCAVDGCPPETNSGPRNNKLPDRESRKLEMTASPENYCEDSYQEFDRTICRTLSGIHYFRYDAQRPQAAGREGNILRGIELINGPDVQEAEMRTHDGGRPSDLKKSLSCKPTCLRFHFKDLRTRDVIEHEIVVAISSQ